MKATNEKKAEGYSSPYNFEGRIPLSQAIPLGLQHVMAMFIGNLTPLIIVMGVCGLTADAGFGELRTALLQNAMIIAGVVTLVQMFSIGPVGGKVPIVMGTSSGFLGVLNNTVAACGGGILAYGAIMGACIVGGIFESVLGAFLKPLRKFFPPIVTGSVSGICSTGCDRTAETFRTAEKYPFFVCDPVWYSGRICCGDYYDTYASAHRYRCRWCSVYLLLGR